MEIEGVQRKEDCKQGCEEQRMCEVLQGRLGMMCICARLSIINAWAAH